MHTVLLFSKNQIIPMKKVVLFLTYFAISFPFTSLHSQCDIYDALEMPWLQAYTLENRGGLLWCDSTTVNVTQFEYRGETHFEMEFVYFGDQQDCPNQTSARGYYNCAGELVCNFFPLWPESYCYTYQDAVEATGQLLFSHKAGNFPAELELISEPTNVSPIFIDYPFLNEVVDKYDCTNTTVTVFASGIYKYLLVEDATSSILYNQDGVTYCQNSSNYDCVAAYNLTEVIATWNCQDSQEENEPPFTLPNDTSVFTTYDWLNTLVDQNNCANTSVTVYGGIFGYVLVEDDTSGILYNNDGVVYCQNTPNYDCVEAYFLTEVVAIWSCEGSQEENEPPTTPPNDASIFTDYDWLSALVDQNSCANTSVTVYASGIYQYIYVENAIASILYNQDGLFYCQDAPNYDCVAAYNLTEVIATWNCNNDNINTPTINTKFNKTNSFSNGRLTVYPNPASDRLFIEVPTGMIAEVQTIQLVNISGEVLQQLKTENLRTEINLSAYAAGMYFIKWQSNSTSQIQRFIIK